MNEREFILNEKDAIVYLAQHFSIHTNQMHMLIRQNVFYQKDPLLIIQNMETADYFFSEYLRKRHAKVKRKDPAKANYPKGYPFSITEANGKKSHFYYKRDVYSYFAARYQRKTNTMAFYFRDQMVFWTREAKKVALDVRRADAYFHAYLQHFQRFTSEDLKERAQMDTNNRPAYDGGYHMKQKTTQPANHEELLKTVDSIFKSDKIPSIPDSKKVSVQTEATRSQTYHNVAPLKEMPAFKYSLSYPFKDELERYDAQREALQYLGEAFSLKARTIEKHFIKGIYSSDDPLVMAQDLKATYQEYLNYLHESKEGARRKLINQQKPETPKAVSNLSSTIKELEEQQAYKRHQINDARKTIQRLQAELAKSESEIVVIDNTIKALQEAQKVLNK